MDSGVEVYKKSITRLFKGKETLTPERIVDVYTEWGEKYETSTLVTQACSSVLSGHIFAKAYYTCTQLKLQLDREAGFGKKEMLGAGYIGHQLCAEYFEKHAAGAGLNKDSRVLDIACGSGLVGVEMRRRGFSHVDGLDVCPAMLEEARKKDVYTRLIESTVGNGHAIPVESGTYAGVTISAVLPNLQEDGIRDILRLITKGGLLVIVARENHIDGDAAWFESLMASLEQVGTVRQVEVTRPDKFYMDIPAVVYVYTTHEQ